MKYLLGFGVLWYFFLYIGISNGTSAITASLLMFASVCASVWQKYKEDELTNAEHAKLKRKQRDLTK